MKEKIFLYDTLYQTIKNEVESGVLITGQKLPHESVLCTRFGVSPITIKKALTMLADDGYVRRVPGKGTFVRENPELASAQNASAAIKLPRNTQLIGMILEHVATPFGLEMLYEIDRLMHDQGYRLCIRYSYSDRDRETEELQFLLSLGVAGLIMMPCHGSYYNKALLRLIIDDFPIVLVDKKMEGIPVPSVRTDNDNATTMLVRHLYERGCKNIALLSIEAAETTSLVERRVGFTSEIARLELAECPPCYVRQTQDMVKCEPDVGIIASVRAHLHTYSGEIDAFVCAEYGVVSGLVSAAKSEGVTIGAEGIRVCCIDEDYLAPHGYSFTHMRQDEKTIAARVVDTLLARLQQRDDVPDDIVIPAIFRQGITT